METPKSQIQEFSDLGTQSFKVFFLLVVAHLTAIQTRQTSQQKEIAE